MIVIRDLYGKLEDNTNVYVVDRDLISPQVKYVISQMQFFIGTRMHANFAAIYTGVPLLDWLTATSSRGLSRQMEFMIVQL